MEVIHEGKLFRLVQDDELPSILTVLEKHLPHALKVRQVLPMIPSIRAFKSELGGTSASNNLQRLQETLV